jgi:hypothetical protein
MSDAAPSLVTLARRTTFGDDRSRKPPTAYRNTAYSMCADENQVERYTRIVLNKPWQWRLRRRRLPQLL